MNMNAPKQHQGIGASVLIIVALAISTLISTKFKASLLWGTSTDPIEYETLLQPVNISGIAPRKQSNTSVNEYVAQQRNNVDDLSFRFRGKSKELSNAQTQDLSEGAYDNVDGLGGNRNDDDQMSSDDEFDGDDEFDDDDDEIDDDVDEFHGGHSDGDNHDEWDEDETNDNDNEPFDVGKLDRDPVLSQLSPHIKNILTNSTKITKRNEVTASPACHPHFHLSLPNNQWNNTTKFRRIYFYHARKAGGSSMHKYLMKVATEHGLEFKAVEWSAMEEPGTTDDNATFYVTHLREPISRSISHFKYQGRWDCHDLSVGWAHSSFVPTVDNANKIETWNQTGGHEPITCGRKRGFRLGMCAVNCYTQWFSGLSCPGWRIPVKQQYEVAKEKLMKFNLVVVIEKLRDPNYVQVVEDMFGVSGITKKGTPFCERPSHKANSLMPLIIPNATLEGLTKLNQVDIKFYHEMSDCLDSGRYDFPRWDPNRFELNNTNYDKRKKKTAKKDAKLRAKAAKAIKSRQANERAKAKKEHN